MRPDQMTAAAAGPYCPSPRPAKRLEDGAVHAIVIPEVLEIGAVSSPGCGLHRLATHRAVRLGAVPQAPHWPRGRAHQPRAVAPHEEILAHVANGAAEVSA
jgi:hypothetical protein